jgi:hypothetical protein
LKITVDLIGSTANLKELENTILQFRKTLADEFRSQVVPRTPIDQGRARAGWQQRQSGTNISVENSVPYIERLERGYSRQAPRGFVKQAITATIRNTNKKLGK